MNAEQIKAELIKAARRAWPKASRASELPFPEYWKSVQEWLTFHAPHVGDKLMSQFVAEAVREAVMASAVGGTPRKRVVPEEVREVWRSLAKDGVRRAEPASQDKQDNDAWEHAAERAAAVNDRFAGRRRVYGR